MRRSPDDPLPEEGPEVEAGAEALALMQRLQMALGACSLDVALEAIGNVFVLLAVAASNSKAEAHEVIDDEWAEWHQCLDLNYAEAARMHAESERCGATVH